MKKTIWKYDLDRETQSDIQMPRGAKILSVQLQRNGYRLWALVHPTALLEIRTFVIYGTGWDMEYTDNLEYLETIQEDGFVWHIFEVKNG